MTDDWIGLALIVLILVGAVFGLSRLGRPPERLSAEEFERRVQEARGTTRAGVFAGMHALQKLLNPRAAEAVETQRDLRAGFYNEKEQGGEGDGEGADEDGDAVRKKDAGLRATRGGEGDDA